jgi:drug/metabolite transporter (DMT)-like permease
VTRTATCNTAFGSVVSSYIVLLKAKSALIGSLETPLAPAWVWLAVGEIPAVATVVGGLIVLAAILADILLKKSSAVPERVEQAA